MKNIIILLFILLVSCTRQSDSTSEQKGHSSDTTNRFGFLIRDGQIGQLKTGDKLNDVFEKLKGLRVVRDSVAECEGCNSYTPLYVVSTFDNKDLFVFEPGWYADNRDRLFRIRTTNKDFITDKGIRVGMTVKDLKEKYKLDEVDVSGETGIHILVEGFNGAFGIELPKSNDFWGINKENIPDTLRIDEIIIL
ncbi:MAG: hypothetical protein HYZ44_14625 [Bacteroidetes bacterium]|nr:hypothetical protein [Bacteroidota bacterium]